MAASNPLLEALPPATDYLTYLTIIEYNLTPESLPTLHQVLQDTKLTTNIGWDLVHLLLPLLPASQQCLQDIARLGNPREVILKVTECLRLIDFDGLDTGSDYDEHVPPSLDPDSHRHPHTTAVVTSGETSSNSQSTQAVEIIPAPLPVDQFICLLSMLSILHPRVKTNYPSRFLSTSLQAVLHAFSKSVSHREELLSAIIRFLKDVSTTGTRRPHLPSRASSSTVVPTKSAERAPDPEPDAGSEKPTLSESEIQTRLIQSLVTFAISEYMLGLTSREDAPGLSWSSRIQEKLHPERTVPGRPSFGNKYEKQTDLRARLSAFGEALAFSQDLDIKTEDLLDATQLTDTLPSTGSDEADPPKTASEIPYSKTGALLLYTARVVRGVLYPARSTQVSVPIFPAHQALLSSFVSDSASTGATIGSEPEALLDALLSLALLSVEENNIGQPKDAESFNQYLQSLSLISSNCPSPSLRYIAYYLTTTILRSNPSDIERLAFIRDTLEHCPFDNLKVAAVSWIKGETVEANQALLASPSGSSASQSQENAQASNSDHPSIFATPVALNSVAPYLFPDLTHDLSAASMSEAWQTFDENLQMYLAALNFYFLLLSAPRLRQALDIDGLHTNNDIGGSFLGPLREATERFSDDAKAEAGELIGRWQDERADVDAELAKLELMKATLDKVTGAVAKLNTSS